MLDVRLECQTALLESLNPASCSQGLLDFLWLKPTATTALHWSVLRGGQKE